jgi:hypothetical protein
MQLLILGMQDNDRNFTAGLFLILGITRVHSNEQRPEVFALFSIRFHQKLEPGRPQKNGSGTLQACTYVRPLEDLRPGYGDGFAPILEEVVETAW